MLNLLGSQMPLNARIGEGKDRNRGARDRKEGERERRRGREKREIEVSALYRMIVFFL